MSKADTWMPFYVTDYLGDTMHLTTVQHGAYLLMLLACWKAGGALVDDDAQLSAITRLSAADWKKNAPVLRQFFAQADDRLEHRRVITELGRAKELSEKRKAIGKKGGRPPKALEEQNQLDKQTETNRFPEAKQNETPSPSPSQIHEEKTKKHSASLAPFGVSDSVWEDFLKIRRAKKSPMNNTALAGIQREADKAGVSLEQALMTCCERGWAGFKADWMHDRGNVKPFVQQNRYAGAAAAIFEDATHV